MRFLSENKRIIRSFILSFIILFHLLSTSSGYCQEYIAPYTAIIPTIDGQIDSAEWQFANKYSITFYRTDGQSSHVATLYLQHDTAWLYVGVESEWNAGWNDYLQLRFDGDNNDTLSGNSTMPHMDFQDEYPSPGGWGGYNDYRYLVGLNEFDITPPAGTQKGSFGSTNVTYEFSIKISDFNISNCRFVGFYMRHGNDGTSPHDYEFPTSNTRTNPNQWSKIYLEPSIPCPGIPTVSYSGRTYNTVLICSQCWLKENLNVGNMINGIQDQTNDTIIEKYCYNNVEDSCSVYGGLYQWDEMMQYNSVPGSQGICPVKWHIPDNTDWNQLITSLGGSPVGGGKAKEIGFRHWLTPNTGASDFNGFSALGSGKNSTGGGFEVLNMNEFFWSSNQGTDFHLYNSSSEFAQGNSGNYWGLSVRCIYDSVFTNSNQAPLQPINFNPPDNSINNPLNLTLSWNCTDPENDPMQFDVYFGPPGNMQLIQSSICAKTCLVNNLQTCTTYQWQVVAKDNQCNSTSGPVWSFSTSGTDTIHISIIASTNPVCQGSSVTYLATPVNGGSNPMFQWKVNGNNTGTNSPIYIYNPTNNDVVTCVLTSNDMCVIGNPATSNSITMSVNPLLPVSVSVSSSANPVCQSTCVDFTATVLNGGSSPTYQWFVNGNNVFTSNSNLTNGLVAYYPFNGNANDESGNGNNGTVNGATLTNDRFGNANSAYIFNGTTNLIDCGNNSSLQLTNTLTISLWFNSSDTNKVGEYLLSKTIIPGNYEYCIEIETMLGVPQLIATVGGLNYVEAGIGSIPAINTWHYFAATYSYPGYLKIFYDGALYDSVVTTGSIMPTSQDLVLGCIRPSGEPQIRYFAGDLDDIRVYNRSLSNCELKELYFEGLSSFSFTPNNDDVVTCAVTSSAICAINNPSTSAPDTMIVNVTQPVGVAITASQNPACSGTSVTFTATAANGGTTPSYQWKVNGADAGTNSSTFTYTPANNDSVRCVINSSLSCVTGNPAYSNQINMVVTTGLPAGISIAASNNPFCSGLPVTFTATPINGGSNPSYQWKVNGINAGSNSSTFTYNPTNNDSVRCVMTSNLSCVTGNPASSAKIIMIGGLAPVVTFTSCFDTITTIIAQPIKLKGGIPLGGTYSGQGVNSTTGMFTPAAAGTGTKTIMYTYTNAALCSASKITHIIVQSSPVFSCGNNLTDIRDNKVYPTVQIGLQCWLASNLNHGTFLAAAQDQRDNCVSEKYCYNDNPINCTTQGGLYQWDELMQFDDSPGSQGFCPPGWHIPTEDEWIALFSNWTNNAFAASPLKYSGFSGFNAFLSGARHINKSWDFLGFATFFWSSTSHSITKAWAHGMNTYDPSVSLYPSSRVNAFSVRCLQDYSTIASLPTVVTDSIYNITQTTAVSSGDVTSDGGASVIARGVCWSTSPNPTTSDSHTTDGSGLGIFISYLTGLNDSTLYYVRAYAVNIIGIAYGNEITFSTGTGQICYFSDNFNDGDFTNNPHWDFFPGGTGCHVTGTAEVVNGQFHEVKTNAFGCGTGTEIEHSFDLLVTDSTKITFDINPVFSDVGNGAGWTNEEYPAYVDLRLWNANNDSTDVRFCYNYRGGVSHTDGTYMFVVFPNCAQNVWLTGQQFRFRDYVPDAIRCSKITIGGNGWDYEGLIDNINIVCQ